MLNAKSTRLWLPIAVLACSTGCSDSDTEPEADLTVTVTYTITEFVPGDGGPAIEGAEICILEPADVGCATTDADGVASFVGLTPGDAFYGRVIASGFLTSFAHGYVADEDAGLGLTLPSDAIAQAFADSVMIMWPDPQNGVIAFNAFNAEGSGKPGVQVSLSPSSGEGPFYTSDAGLPDAMLTETQGPLGFFTGVAPGDYEVTFPGCEITGGWRAGADGVATTESVADGLATVSATCP